MHTHTACRELNNVAKGPLMSEAADASAALSFESLRRSRATVEDFARSYFPLHGLPMDRFLQVMDVFVFIEASLYEADEAVEAEVEEAADAIPQLIDPIQWLPRLPPVGSTNMDLHTRFAAYL